MKFLTRLKRPDTQVDYLDDVTKISEELKRQGFTASLPDIAWAYGEYSESRWCTSWFSLDCEVVTLEQAAKGVRELLVTAG